MRHNRSPARAPPHSAMRLGLNVCRSIFKLCPPKSGTASEWKCSRCSQVHPRAPASGHLCFFTGNFRNVFPKKPVSSGSNFVEPKTIGQIGGGGAHSILHRACLCQGQDFSARRVVKPSMPGSSRGEVLLATSPPGVLVALLQASLVPSGTRDKWWGLCQVEGLTQCGRHCADYWRWWWWQ